MSPDCRAWAAIDADALAHNIAVLRSDFSPARVMVVVKADAYGHGAALIAPLCYHHGLRDFGIATPSEGAALRGLLHSDVAIYLLGPTLPAEAPVIVAHCLIPLLSSVEMGQALSHAAQAQGVIAEAHLDVDTGIGRAGVPFADARAILHVLDRLPNLQITGIATHFASADEDPADACAQQELFQRTADTLGGRADNLIIHASNSPAALNLPTAAHSLIRPGLLLYGIEPMPGDFAAHSHPYQSVLSLKARVTLCRSLPAETTISYGRTYAVPQGGGVYATLGIGYGDGYPRRLSNIGYVVINGLRAPICGRVCMDQLVVDVTQIPGVQTGDIATLIGTDGDETIRAGYLASEIGTTPHEITTCLTARIPRILVNNQ